ncbi:MAG: TetR/AcrR family transcriptional regulator [Polyangia bacterium]
MARPCDPNARLELLAAAQRVFIEHGLDATKVEDITEQAGRSKGSFYLHFESKEEAFTYVVEDVLGRLSAFLDAQAALDVAPPESLEALFELWVASSVEIFEFVWTNRGVMRLVLRGGLSSRFHHLIDAFFGHVHRHIERALLQGQSWGIYRADLDLRIAALALAGAYDRVARELVESEHKPDLHAIITAVDSTLLGGIGSDAVRNHVMQQTNHKRKAKR